MKYCLTIICLFIFYNSNGQINHYTIADGVPEGRIMGLFQGEDRVYYISQKNEKVYGQPKVKVFFGFFDGYDFHNIDISHINLIPESFVSLFESYNEDYFVVVFQVKFKVILIDKKTFECKKIITNDEISLSQVKIRNGRLIVPKIEGNNTHLVEISNLHSPLASIPFIDRDISIIPLDSTILVSGMNNYFAVYDYDGNEIKQFNPSTCGNLEATCNPGFFSFYDYIFIRDTLYLKIRSAEPNLIRYDERTMTLKLDDRSRLKYLHFIPKNDEENNLIYLNGNKNKLSLEILFSRQIKENYHVSEERIEAYDTKDATKELFFAGNGYLTHVIKEGDTNKKRRRFYGKRMRGMKIINDSLMVIGFGNDNWRMFSRTKFAEVDYFTTEQRRFLGGPSFSFDYSDKTNNIISSTQDSFLIYNTRTKQRMAISNNLDVINASCSTGNNYYVSAYKTLNWINKEKLTTHKVELPFDRGLVNYLTPYNDHSILICAEKGLYVFNESNKSFTVIDSVQNFICAYHDAVLNENFVADLEGRIYKLESIDSLNLLFEHKETVFEFLKDDKGRWWLGSTDGVWVENEKNTYKFKNALHKDHLAEECNRYSMLYDQRHNTMYVGTVEGLNIIDMKKVFDDYTFELQQSYLKYIKNDSIITNYYYDSSNVVKIQPDESYVNIAFHTNARKDNRNINYQYKINDDNVWKTLETNKFIRNHFSPGEYKISVRAVSSYGQISNNLLLYHIHKEDYYFNKWWFRLIIAMVVSGVILAWVFRLRSENLRLEKEVRLRTKKIENDKELIERQASSLAEANEMKSRFFKNLSHELRTPLTLITSPLEGLLKKEELSDEDRYRLNLIKNNSEMLDSRVNELLDLAKLESGRIQTKREVTRLDDLLYKSNIVFKQKAEAKGLGWEVNNAIGEKWVLTDKSIITKIVQNLINNAIKFTDEGFIRVLFEMQEDDLIIQVEDTGIGIPQEKQELIFQRFYQVDNELTKANPGTGLGLSMVAEYTALMGGIVELESKHGQGSIFTIKLPMDIIEKPDYITDNNHQLQEEIAAPWGVDKPHLLIVEDNEELLDFLGNMFSVKYKITKAKNGVVAWETLQMPDTDVHLILSDVMMPLMDGETLLRKVRDSGTLQSIPFIFLSAKEDEAFKRNMIKCGVDDYITKPFSEKELGIRIEVLLNNYKNRIAAEYDPPIRHGSKKMDTQSLNSVAVVLQKLILEHCTHPKFGTAFLAEEVGMSRRNLQRVLKKEIGLTPLSYINEVRLNEARIIREENSSLSVNEIAEKLGFVNHQHFSKLFFQRFGYRL